ncbi:MAG: tripartite tricarboxylate transporter substrate binding protein [Hyphomicrobiales bacterium]|nr:tripartite tricarboxylate transporter substrate binding protein [Hyphomicrobiales bacterium]MCP5373675.1 tripartite tricarboxylate transporter substrate binding protein [Hyphomicrobiales bacterium]
MRTLKTLALSAVVGVLAASTAWAFPDKPISYIIPFGPGGESDITARHQQAFFKGLFGQDLVIEYKPGGSGAVAWAQLNAAKGDGYTIMGINLPHIVIQPRQKDVGYKTDEITGVYMFHYTPDAIVVNKDSDFKTLQDLIDYAKKNPGKVTFSGSGKGTANHLAQVRFDKMAGIKTTYVPFKGTGASVTALLGGQVLASWGYTSVGAKHADKVRLLAVAMNKRHPKLADAPTFKELGFDLVSGAYRGIAVPKSTPEAIRVQLSEMIGKINAMPKFIERMENDGMALLDVDYKGMPAFMAEMTEVYEKAAREAGVIK